MLTTDQQRLLNLDATDTFVARHVGPQPDEIEAMLETIGVKALGALIDAAVPESIRHDGPLSLPSGKAERDVLSELQELASENQVFRSYIGMGYHGCVTPPVLLRNILQNPGWYTQYTPYQAEISQGRLEALLNFQTMIMDLTGMDVANASLLDEATAAAEAMTMCRRSIERKRPDATTFFVSERCHPQTIDVVRTRAEPLGLTIVVGDHERARFDDRTFGALVQYPDTNGVIHDFGAFCDAAHEAGASVVVAADPLALALFRPPGEFGADVAVGSAQRFGVPLGYGGPHAAYIAAKDAFKRQLPGRVVGVTKDTEGRPALRLALQTREQHIRRDKATSNICTAQVLLAIVAAMYGVYHGADGLTRIARRVRALTGMLKDALVKAGYDVSPDPFFDTIRVVGGPRSSDAVHAAAIAGRYNLRAYPDGAVGVSLDQTTTTANVRDLIGVFGGDVGAFDASGRSGAVDLDVPAPLGRTSPFLTHPVFQRYRSETEMVRYLKRLENRDLSLTQSMIPLGSCTMKLNGTAEMLAMTWPAFANLHPFAPSSQTAGYKRLFERLEAALCEITGFDAVTLQPNSGAQGEYTGLLLIRAAHRHRGDERRDVCLIPQSAHGTNPASAVMAGMTVVVVPTGEDGNIDVAALKEKASEHRDRLAAIMITYPSTHGVFEATIRDICGIVHEHGGLVYLDGANMNAMVGVARPAEFGADVCHLNLHKTFCIPHGGGGPGMGPVCVTKALAPFLPGHVVVPTGGEHAIGAVSAAPWGSPSILTISYAYIALMGARGLRLATDVAILNANYIAKRLDACFPVLYRGANGLVAHECILDLRPAKTRAGVEVEDVAKRLIDYGFHAPTMSWPVIGTLMVEPTESESKRELDRFCDAMIAIAKEIDDVAEGRLTIEESPLRNAPHPAEDVLKDDWARAYSRETAVFPAPWSRELKFWPPVSRADNVAGDRHLVCACPPIEAYTTL